VKEEILRAIGNLSKVEEAIERAVEQRQVADTIWATLHAIRNGLRTIGELLEEIADDLEAEE